MLNALAWWPQDQGVGDRIQIPCSVRGLTSKRLLVMSYIDGVQASSYRHLPPHPFAFLFSEEAWLCEDAS